MTTIRGTNPVATHYFPTNNLPQQPAGPSEREQFRTAVNTLKANFGDLKGGFFDDTIDMNELYRAAQSGNPQVREAARFLLAHPEMLGELDVARHGGGTDGKISMSDIDTQLGRLDREQALRSLVTDPRASEFASSLQTLNQYWGALDTAGGFLNFGKDGKVSQDDLNAIAGNPRAPAELRRAALFMSLNQDLWGLVDVAAEGGNKDGVVSVKDLEAFNTQLQNVVNDMQPRFQTPYRQY